MTEKQKQLDPIDEVDEEEDKVEKLQTPPNRTTTTSSLIKKSSLSAKSTRIFTPSTMKNKDKDFEVDEKGLLKITKFEWQFEYQVYKPTGWVFQEDICKIQG